MYRYPWNQPERDYHVAAVCRRGHVESSVANRRAEPLPEHCLRCGAPILTACPACQRPIRGSPANVVGIPYHPADFCGCGNPFPWASDEAIRWHIENQLEADDLPEAERRDLQRQLDVLVDRDAEPKRRAAAVMQFRSMAPKAYALAELALRTFITADIQAHIKPPT